MDHGIEIIENRHGEFQNQPEGFKPEDGLLEEQMAAFTKSNIPVERSEDDLFVMMDSNAEPEKIVVDSRLVNDYPNKGSKSLIHELLEWRTAEEFHSRDVQSGDTHRTAEFVENGICREINDRVGEEVCELDWSREYQT